MGRDFLEAAREGEGILVLTVDRPPVNALNFQQMNHLLDALLEKAEDGSVKAIVLTGKGKVFMAGFDIKEIQSIGTPETCFERTMEIKQRLLKLEHLRKPVIAAINGDCLGGGLELAMACHLRFACQRARFGFPEILIATIPSFGGTQRSARLVGKGKALDLLLTGELIGAPEAFRVGFLNGLLPDETFWESVLEVARKIARKSLPSLQAVMDSVTQGMDKGLEQAMVWESQVSSRLIQTEDLKEGISAFFERRKPLFRDR